MRKYLIGIVVFAFLAVGGIWLTRGETEVVVENTAPQSAIIGTSVENRDIELYRFGEGSTELLFVGGIHGGYEWNSTLLAYKFIDHFSEFPELIPESLSVAIIPTLNPDGLYAVINKEGRFSRFDVDSDVEVGTGRFNANDVDLNRNFDCKWAPESTWKGNIVSAGTEAFSEPEARALRDYVQSNDPDAVVFWHSKANAVYASECEEGILPETLILMNAYAEESGYRAVESFDAYPITGDAEGWLASIGIPAITVELETHEDLDWNRNKSAVEELLTIYSLQ